MNSATVNYRLLSRETVLPGSEPSVSRCAQKFLLFQGDGVDDSAASMNEFLKALAAYEFEATKAKAIHATCVQEIDEYAKMSETIARNITDTTTEIEQLREKLKLEQLRRTQKEESETLAKTVNDLPARDVTKGELAKVNKELERLNSLHDKTSGVLSLRQKQFQLLMQSLFELQRAVAEPISHDVEPENNSMEVEE